MDFRSLYTSRLRSIYSDRPEVKSFLRSWFPTVNYGTKEIKLETTRGKEKRAVDVTRGSIGNRNTFSKFTEKGFIPPYYREYFDLTDLAIYDRVIGAMSDGSMTPGLMKEFIFESQGKLNELIKKIDRSKEYQCGQALEDGIVTLASGENIDFKRKAASKLDLQSGSNGYWSGAVDPFEDMNNAGNFMRTEGKYQGNVIHTILGSNVVPALFNNAIFKARADIKRYELGQITGPTMGSNGGIFLGEVSSYSFRHLLWTYNEESEDENDVVEKYVNANKVIFLPDSPEFEMAHGAVPQLIKNVGSVPIQGEYIVGSYQDEREASDVTDIKSAALAMLKAVDKVVTYQAVADES